ncbi:tRNA (adenosine(37)-N6)-threonylcarbamoyltransferase complex dimerization subunit type 1 TsaB [Paenibacillus herberti]|uniref:tRNA (adenosine(37)-N6)-threonylcarbamoyltransferase complex dimerization subunit type 1 TsaB n=1 Tax=Paenibacillus herberti TaxID=1619309 RepID=UPI001FED058F|nr:tRNA (adenosine(37)-N6)-threonylcarbamoyltransferase complex dimerization subunit type 1 TsaB [Paenibacillus herberti]
MSEHVEKEVPPSEPVDFSSAGFGLAKQPMQKGAVSAQSDSGELEKLQDAAIRPDREALVLAIDSSTPMLAAALVRGNELLGSVQSLAERNHSAHAVPAVQRLLKAAGIDGSQLAGIAAGRGPGSYTGVRIAASIAKTLAWTWGVPLLGVSSLESLAVGAWSAANSADADGAGAPVVEYAGEQHMGKEHTVPTGSGWVVPLLDARRGQVYTALFVAGAAELPAAHGYAVEGGAAAAADSRTASASAEQAKPAASAAAPASDASTAGGEWLPLDASWSRLETDGLRPMETWASQLADRLSSMDAARRPAFILFTGDLDKHEQGIQQLESLAQEKLQGTAVLRVPHTIDGRSVAWLGRRRLAGGEADDPHGFIPNYTQLAEAEAKLLEKPREEKNDGGL